MFFYLEKWVIRSFPHFWWAMWAKRSGWSPRMIDVSESLRSLTKNERPWANCSGWSFANLFAKNERFAQKTDERIPNPAFWVLVFLELSFLSWPFHKKWNLILCVFSARGWEFALSIFPSTLFRSKYLSLKSDRGWFALVVLYKRATGAIRYFVLSNQKANSQPCFFLLKTQYIKLSILIHSVIFFHRQKRILQTFAKSQC